MTLDHPLPGNFPPPTTPEELGARILIQERYEKFGESEEVEMEVESDEEDEKQEKAEEPPSQLDQDTQVQDMDEVCFWEGLRAGLSLWSLRRWGCSPQVRSKSLVNLERSRGSQIRHSG